ncbi:hypothetical protein D3C81_1926360 [compost metagenome]
MATTVTVMLTTSELPIERSRCVVWIASVKLLHASSMGTHVTSSTFSSDRKELITSK